MRKITIRRWRIIFVVAIALINSGCGYNILQNNDKYIRSSWLEVVNQYQRRSDLIPNLIESVETITTKEENIILEVINASAKVNDLKMTPEVIASTQDFAKFESAQREFSSSLYHLLLVAKNYSELQSNLHFRYLQSQLVEIEERLAVARNRHIKAVENYNSTMHSFPASFTAKMTGFKKKPTFSAPDDRQFTLQPAANSAAPDNTTTVSQEAPKESH